jgi:hypothetical protein
MTSSDKKDNVTRIALYSEFRETVHLKSWLPCIFGKMAVKNNDSTFTRIYIEWGDFTPVYLHQDLLSQSMHFKASTP